VDRLGSAGGPGLRGDGYPAGGLFNDHLVDEFALLGGQGGEFAGASPGNQAMQTVADEEVDVPAQGGLVNGAVRSERGRDGSEDAAQLLAHGWVPLVLWSAAPCRRWSSEALWTSAYR